MSKTNAPIVPTTSILDARVELMKSAILSQNPRNNRNAWLASRSPARGFGKNELYPLGFKMGADVLIDYITEDGAPFRWNEALLYPIFFGYGHSIELRLKNQIRRLSGFPKEAPRSMRRDRHDLLALWKTLRDLLTDLDTEESFRDDYDELETYVRVLHELDERSVSFRYADADFPVRDEDTRFGVVNLEKLKDHVAELGNLMEKLGLI